MTDSYTQLIKKAKGDYLDYRIHPETVGRKRRGKIVFELCPRWYDIGLGDGAVEELNLWNYWQGIGVEHPKLMLVGQDWGHIKPDRRYIENIRQIASDPDTEVQYLSDCGENSRDFDTDNNLRDIFQHHLDRKLFERRYPDLYFTNLCLGYRMDDTTGYWRQSWMTIDAHRYFRSLVEIKQPTVIVCLGHATSKTAYKALTGRTLKMPNGFYGYIDNQGDGLKLTDYCNARFFAVPHPGGMGKANRESAKGGNKSMVDDWAFLKTVF